MRSSDLFIKSYVDALDLCNECQIWGTKLVSRGSVNRLSSVGVARVLAYRLAPMQAISRPKGKPMEQAIENA